MVVDRNRQIAALEQRGGRLSDAFASRDVHRDERAGDAVERSRRNQLGRARQEAKTLVDGLVFREQAGHALAKTLERRRQTELGAQAVAVRAHMPADDEIVARPQRFGYRAEVGVRLGRDRHGASLFAFGCLLSLRLAVGHDILSLIHISMRLQ